MSITDELREYANTRISPNKGMLTAIADRIDIAHKHAIGYVDDRDPDTMAENGWVRLPKDADGEYIHIGDVMETFACPAQDYRKLVVYAIAERDVMSTENEFFAFSEIRHYHAPTVEDVLREMLDAWGELPCGATNEAIVAEYAKRLQLREVDE